MGSICDRHHGIGADGVLVYQGRNGTVISLDHYDPDGHRSFCLNGARAAVACLIQKNEAPRQGEIHTEGVVLPYGRSDTLIVDLPRRPYRTMVWNSNVSGFFADVGNPQFVTINSMSLADFEETAPKIRNDLKHFPQGTNVNLLISRGADWHIRTYERGVEGFTKACGSGMYAASLVLFGERSLESIRFFADGQGWVKMGLDSKGLSMEGSTRWVASGVWLCGD